MNLNGTCSSVQLCVFLEPLRAALVQVQSRQRFRYRARTMVCQISRMKKGEARDAELEGRKGFYKEGMWKKRA